jgi:hypothetical protein
MLILIAFNLRNEDHHLANSLQVFLVYHKQVLVLHNNPVERPEWVRPSPAGSMPIQLHPSLEPEWEPQQGWVHCKAQALELSRRRVLEHS